MPLLDNIGDIFKTLRVYLMGRGALSLLLGAAMFIGGPVPALVVGIGGAALQGFMRLRSHRMYEEQMVDLYRDDIATRLNIAPEQVTRAHLKEAAKDNEVIDQALQRQKHMSIISFATSALAGIVTFGLLDFGLAHEALNGFFATNFGAAGDILKFTSMGLVAGTTSLFVHDGLQAAIGAKTGVSKAAAHDRIVEMERGIRRGWGISKEQVYGVLVAGNPQLQVNIQRQFGKPYSRMNGPQQAAVINQIGIAEEMQLIANEINTGKIRPGNLAYMIADANAPMRPKRTEAKPNVIEQTLAPAKGFVEKLNLAPRAQQSQVAKLDADRAMAALVQPQR